MRLPWRWLPWKFVIRRLARAHGVLDPLSLVSQIFKLAQPSEVAAPMELVRGWVVFHARGLLNTRAIQSNLDWIWPYWVQRQFDPGDTSFLPRAFSITHVNLTHRNWTAVGLPDCVLYPIVDPRGLVTPFFDGWSLDGWVFDDTDQWLLPPKAKQATQNLVYDDRAMAVETLVENAGMSLRSTVDVILENNDPVCRLRYLIRTDRRARFALALRPCNPEGVSIVRSVSMSSDKKKWSVNDVSCIRFDTAPSRHLTSTYQQGDVYRRLLYGKEQRKAVCKAGLASAAAVYDVKPGVPKEVEVRISLLDEPELGAAFPTRRRSPDWSEALRKACKLDVPDQRIRFLFDAAVRSIILHAPLEIYPGPYTYKRFWFRDAVMILNAMISLGLHDRCERTLEFFPERQNHAGFFHSQEGEWDSNGQVMWIFRRFCDAADRPCRPEWLKSLIEAARWIKRKRTSAAGDHLHAGLLPAGFSAEHLGNNDYYYWDDFWSVAGLRETAVLCDRRGDYSSARALRAEAVHLMRCIEKSLERSRSLRNCDALPASPYRRMDAGAVGSIVAGYPLQLLSPQDSRLKNTVEFLMKECFFQGAFFQDMVHSGINAYLSLHCAQVLLRAGDPRSLEILTKTAELASPTGQWPEAIHPRTLGGCMGDGQHIWAAAEWIMMLKHLFVREEGEGLVLLQGIPAEWTLPGQTCEIGPVYTDFGPLTIRLQAESRALKVSWEPGGHLRQPTMDFRPPGWESVRVTDPDTRELTFSR